MTGALLVVGAGVARPATFAARRRDGAVAGRDLLHRPRRETRHVIVEEEDVEDDDGDRAKDGASHELTPEVDITPDELAGDAHAGRDLVGRRGEGQRIDELVPGQGEREQSRAYQSGDGDGQHRSEERRVGKEGGDRW